MGDYAHYGMATSEARWGAMTHRVGERTDVAIQRAREAVAGFLSAVTPWEFEADPSERVATRARGR